MKNITKKCIKHRYKLIVTKVLNKWPTTLQGQSPGIHFLILVSKTFKDSDFLISLGTLQVLFQILGPR